MEIYKDLNSPATQQFEKLLNTQLSKNKIEEGKIIEGKITKITEKYIFLFIPGLKSEPVIDINEMKMIGMQDKIVEGEKVSVLLEKIEEELLELRDSLPTGDRDQIKSELGDLLFSCVNLSRQLNLDAEESLRCATARFEKRFVTMENEVRRSGRLVKDLSMADYNALWEKAKKLNL